MLDIALNVAVFAGGQEAPTYQLCSLAMINGKYCSLKIKEKRKKKTLPSNMASCSSRGHLSHFTFKINALMESVTVLSSHFSY